MEINIFENCPISIYLFGSYSRNEQKTDSDIDFLLITKTSDDYKHIQDFLDANKLSARDVSIYTYDKLKEYFQQGHLFAWHLFLEAKKLNGPNTLQLLGPPSEYKDFESDSIQILELIESSLKVLSKKDPSTSLNYEAGLVYLSLRNFSHFFSAFYLKNYCFSRFSPFQLDRYSISEITLMDYEILMKARFSSIRGHTPNLIQREWLINMCQRTKKWINELIEVVHEI